jgi:uncharacterized protein (TIGR02453 family)
VASAAQRRCIGTAEGSHPDGAAFSGFGHDALQFLVDMAFNNERPWFQERKATYLRLLKEPLESLCVALDGEFRARGIPLAADPRRSPFRIYRDVRFSKDKSPYKTHLSASFPWSGQGGGVGGYFHLQPGNVYIGGGMWHPTPARLVAWRRAVIDERARIHAIIDAPDFRAAFGPLDGERLKRGPSGFPADDPDADLLRLKDVTFGRRLPDAAAGSSDLPAAIAEDLSRAVPLLSLLARLPGFEDPVPWLRR